MMAVDVSGVFLPSSASLFFGTSTNFLKMNATGITYSDAISFTNTNTIASFSSTISLSNLNSVGVSCTSLTSTTCTITAPLTTTNCNVNSITVTNSASLTTILSAMILALKVANGGTCAVSQSTKPCLSGSTCFNGKCLVNGASLGYCASGISCAANTTCISNLCQPIPVAPTGVSASAGNASAVVSWNAVTYATSYSIYWSGSSTTTTSTSVTISGLANGTSYTFTVYAINSSGTSPVSNSSTCVPKAPNGTGCSSAGQCSGGYCTGGVCYSGPPVNAQCAPGCDNIGNFAVQYITTSPAANGGTPCDTQGYNTCGGFVACNPGYNTCPGYNTYSYPNCAQFNNPCPPDPICC